MAVAITKKPTAKVSYMSAPRRNAGGSRTMVVTYKLAASATDDNNPARIEGFEVLWDVRAWRKGDSKKSLYRHFSARYAETDLRSVHLDLTRFKPTELKKVLTRDDYYPQSTWCVRVVMCAIRCYNRKGVGPYVITEAKFLQPAQPSISALVQDAESGTVSCKVTIPSGENMQEVYNGFWRRTVYNSATKKTSTVTGTIARGQSATVGYDVSNRQGLTHGQYIRVTVEAWSRGYWGDSKVSKRTAYVSYPTKPVINKLEIPDSKPATKVTVRLKYEKGTNGKLSKDPHPTTGVKLQKLVNVPYAKASAIPGDASWVDVAVDDGECSALACTVGDLQCAEAGLHSWIRVKTWNEIEEIFCIYSDPKHVAALYKEPPPEPTAADDPTTIVSVASEGDGGSVALTWAWQPAGTTDDATGTEISWSDDGNAWSSTDPPKTYQSTTRGTAEDTVVPSKSGGQTVYTTYKRKATIHVPGLTKGKTYHFRVRRYLVTEGNPSYGRYSSTARCNLTAAENEATVTAVCSVPRYLERGGSLEVSWTWESSDEDARQTSWKIITGNTTTSGRVTNITSKVVVLASGSDERGAASVTPSQLAAKCGTATSMPIAVVVTVGGVTAQSAAKVVNVADRPTLQAFAPDVTSQPAFIGLYASAACDVAATLSAVGASGEFPDGIRQQVGGDTVWSDVLRPSWAARGLDLGNMVTNLPGNWERGTFRPSDVTEDGQVLAHAGDETGSTTRIRLTRGQAVGVTPGETYTVSLTEDAGAEHGYMLVLYAYDGDGAYVEADSTTTWTAGPLTITPVVATSVRLALRHDDGSAIYPDEIGPGVRVMMAEGATAQAWVPHEGDVAGLSATIELPEGLDLWDGARYQLVATATDRATGMVSDTGECEIGVAWDRQAPVPDTCTVTASDVTDEQGVRTRQATIAIVAPEEGEDEDAYDLYRVTDDGASLVAASLTDGASVVDHYAPWDGTYRVALRTPDGDVAWWDYPYALPGGDVRIDYMGPFGPAYVELPHNLTVQDDYSKPFEVRRKLDGSMDGYWQRGVQRRGSIGVSLDVAGEYGTTMEALRALADHVGPCFVRTPDGCAYEADVEVNGLDRSDGPALFGVSIDTTEVSLTSEFMAEVATEEVSP